MSAARLGAATGCNFRDGIIPGLTDRDRLRNCSEDTPADGLTAALQKARPRHVSTGSLKLILHEGPAYGEAGPARIGGTVKRTAPFALWKELAQAAKLHINSPAMVHRADIPRRSRRLELECLKNIAVDMPIGTTINPQERPGDCASA